MNHHSRPQLSRLVTRHPRKILLAGISLFLVTAAFRIQFDENGDNIQPRGLPSLRLQQEFNEQFGYFTNSVLVRATSLEECRRITAKLRTLPRVGRVFSLTDFLLPPEQAQAASPA